MRVLFGSCDGENDHYNRFMDGERDHNIPLYFSLEWEKTSQSRLCFTEGWQNLQSAIEKIFAHAITLEILNQTDEASEPVDYIRLNEIVSNDEKDKEVSQQIDALTAIYRASITDCVEMNELDYMIEIYRTSYGNADSRTHTFGDAARQVVEIARKRVASILSVKTDEVFFTSGATESNNIAIQGLKEYALQTGKKHIITSSIEHKAVIETVKHLEKEGFEVSRIYPEKSGRISDDKIKRLVRDDTLLVSLLHVNNETGIIQERNIMMM